MDAHDPAAAFHHRIELGQDALRIRQTHRREDIADEDHRGDAVQRGRIAGPLVEHLDLDAGDVGHILQAMFHQPAARGHLVRAGGMRTGADHNEHAVLRRGRLRDAMPETVQNAARATVRTKAFFIEFTLHVLGHEP